jgi:hypothetical protein
MNQCVFCGQQVDMVHVHGHYQCPVCKTNAMPCCDGDNCDTNVLLKNNEDPKPLQRSPSDKLRTLNIKLINPDSSSGSNYH